MIGGTDSIFFRELQADLRNITGALDQLNANIQAASVSSGKLARALNWLTGVGALAALVGVLVAIIH